MRVAPTLQASHICIPLGQADAQRSNLVRQVLLLSSCHHRCCTAGRCSALGGTAVRCTVWCTGRGGLTPVAAIAAEAPVDLLSAWQVTTVFLLLLLLVLLGADCIWLLLPCC